jgi:hypothetical protein
MNRIQGMRRDLGLEVTDRITVQWSTKDEAIEEAFATYGALIAGQVLAVSIDRGAVEAAPVSIGGAEASIAVRTAPGK